MRPTPRVIRTELRTRRPLRRAGTRQGWAGAIPETGRASIPGSSAPLQQQVQRLPAGPQAGQRATAPRPCLPRPPARIPSCSGYAPQVPWRRNPARPPARPRHPPWRRRAAGRVEVKRSEARRGPAVVWPLCAGPCLRHCLRRPAPAPQPDRAPTCGGEVPHPAPARLLLETLLPLRVGTGRDGDERERRGRRARGRALRRVE